MLAPTHMPLCIGLSLSIFAEYTIGQRMQEGFSTFFHLIVFPQIFLVFYPDYDHQELGE